MLDSLSLWVRHHAWLNTTPDKETIPRRDYKSDEMPPLMPQAFYLLDILFSVGPVMPLGMGGSVGVTDSELFYYQQNNKTPLTGWECFAVRSLSREYASMLVEAKEKNCPAPFVPEIAIDRQKVADGFLQWAEKMGKATEG